MYITFFFHTGGKLVRDNDRVLKYIDGRLDSVPPMDIDLVNYFDLVALFKNFGYHDLTAIHWMHPGRDNFDIGLRPLEGDGDINSMCAAAMAHAKDSSSCDMHIYFEHPVLGVEDVEFVDIEAEAILDNVAVQDLVSSDDYESAEDSLYRPDAAYASDTDESFCESEEVVGLKKSEVKANKKKKTVKRVNVSCSEESDQASFEKDGYASYSEQMRTPESTDDEGSSRQAFPVFNPSAGFGQVYLELGMEFVNLGLFKNAVKDYNIALGRQFVWKKNDKQRARAVCKVEDCSWAVYCAWNSLTKAYQIKTFVPEHTCCRVFQNRGATRDWVAKKLEQRLLTQPDLKRRQAYDIMKEDFNVHLNEKKLSRALKKARLAVEGSEKDQYGRAWDYLHELLRSNPRSTARMDVIPGNPPLFDRLYVCLEACKAGFKAGCRPLIGLDGCFLKGYYGGQLLSAVAQDANNQFYVIAYAVVDSETKENWKWFLTLMENDLGDHVTYGWNFISDQQKGLLPALKEVMAGAHHRNCVLHIWKNFIKQWKDKELRGVVWECARCTTEAEFIKAMLKLKALNERAWSYLNNIDPGAWVKAYYSHWPKLDNITNNMCEIWNSHITKYMEKLILTMLEELRCYLMRRIAAHKRVLGSYRGRLPSVQQKRLEKLKVESNKWTPTWTCDVENEKYEVQRHRSKVGVSLTHQTCTCQMWQLTGMPCAHAIAAIAYKNERPEDHVHQWLTMEALNATYEHFIQPVNSQEYWVETDYPRPDPPKLKRPIGRPKKHRRKGAHSEDVPSSQQHKVRKAYEVICPKCGESGHYEKTCKGPARPGPSRPRPKRRSTVKKTTTTTSTETVTQNEQTREADQTAPATTDVVMHAAGAWCNEPPSPPRAAVRPPPIRPHGLRTPPAMTPSFTPSTAVGTYSIRPPGLPIRPYRPPRMVGTASEMRFMPTPGFRQPFANNN